MAHKYPPAFGRAANLTHPEVRTVAEFYAKQWAMLPTHAKVLTAYAIEAGISVVHLPERGWVWGADETAFRECGLFKQSMNWGFLQWASTTTGEGLRADFRRCSEQNHLRADLTFTGFGRRSADRFGDQARADAGFQSFKAATLKPIPGLQLEEEETTKEKLRDTWPFRVRDASHCIMFTITQIILDDYEHRDVFPDHRTFNVQWVTVERAQQIIADAGQRLMVGMGRKDNAWHALRARLWKQLTALGVAK